MRKQLALLSIGIMVVVGGVAAFSAFEAHVINVTAHIENALYVHDDEISFGTVFPQEYLTRDFTVGLSGSFVSSNRTDVVSYHIVQKPKCVNKDGQYAPVNYWDEECPEGYTAMPSLCPYLSETPKYIDDSPYTDHGIPAFHDPATSIATGTINKDHDILDEWIIDLAVPCFNGMCAQDWPSFVASHNAGAKPQDYVLPANQEGSNFGCDLWIEPTNIY